ncbi:MAG: hypothetical protein ACRC8S_03025 [Fimbriiglobus sp.]
MKRLFTIILLLSLAVWADAQSTPTPILASERLQLFRANQMLVEDLIDHHLKLANSNSQLDQAEQCRNALTTLSTALNKATEEPSIDGDRVAELSEHMAELLTTGLNPTLAEARAKIQAGSPGAAQLAKIETSATTDLNNLRSQLLNDPRLTTPKVTTATERLWQAMQGIAPKN